MNRLPTPREINEYLNYAFDRYFKPESLSIFVYFDKCSQDTSDCIFRVEINDCHSEIHEDVKGITELMDILDVYLYNWVNNYPYKSEVRVTVGNGENRFGKVYSINVGDVSKNTKEYILANEVSVILSDVDSMIFKSYLSRLGRDEYEWKSEQMGQII